MPCHSVANRRNLRQDFAHARRASSAIERRLIPRHPQHMAGMTKVPTLLVVLYSPQVRSPAFATISPDPRAQSILPTQPIHDMHSISHHAVSSQANLSQTRLDITHSSPVLCAQSSCHSFHSRSFHVAVHTVELPDHKGYRLQEGLGLLHLFLLLVASLGFSPVLSSPLLPVEILIAIFLVFLLSVFSSGLPACSPACFDLKNPFFRRKEDVEAKLELLDVEFLLLTPVDSLSNSSSSSSP